MIRALTERGKWAREAESKDFSALILSTGVWSIRAPPREFHRPQDTYVRYPETKVKFGPSIKKPRSCTESRKGTDRKPVFPKASTIHLISVEVTPVKWYFFIINDIIILISEFLWSKLNLGHEKMEVLGLALPAFSRSLIDLTFEIYPINTICLGSAKGLVTSTLESP